MNNMNELKEKIEKLLKEEPVDNSEDILYMSPKIEPKGPEENRELLRKMLEIISHEE